MFTADDFDVRTVAPIGVAGPAVLDAIDTARPITASHETDTAPQPRRRIRRRGYDAYVDERGPAFSWIVLVIMVLSGVASGAWIWNLKSEQNHLESELKLSQTRLNNVAERVDDEMNFFIASINAEEHLDTLTLYRVYAENALLENDIERFEEYTRIFDAHIDKAIKTLEQEKAIDEQSGTSG